MKKILDRIFVGDKDDVQDALDHGFAVASMTKESKYGHRDTLGYTTLGAPQNSPDYYFIQRGKRFAANLIDVDDPNFIPEDVINPALRFIKKHYDAGEKILIRCEEGHSRGPSTCLMFLRTIHEMPYPFRIAEKIFKTFYPKYDPAKGINIYARTHWAELGEKDFYDRNETAV